MDTKRDRPDSIAGYKKRRRHFLRKRKFAEAFKRADLHDVASDLYDCQETELLVGCHSCGGSWWLVNKCRKRVCPLCAYEVAQERAHFVLCMTKQMQHPKMLSLTQPLCVGDPRDGIKYLRAAFGKLRKHPVFKCVIGGAYQIELKQKDGGWHIHMHIIMDAPFMPYQKLFTAWKDIIGEKCPQIDIRAASSAEARTYACKYATKSIDYGENGAGIVAWYYATKGTRLFGTFGKWYNAKIEELDEANNGWEPKALCPCCGKEKTTFRVRDGPFVFGRDFWLTFSLAFPPEHELVRPIADIEEYDKTYGVPDVCKLTKDTQQEFLTPDDVTTPSESQ